MPLFRKNRQPRKSLLERLVNLENVAREAEIRREEAAAMRQSDFDARDEEPVVVNIKRSEPVIIPRELLDDVAPELVEAVEPEPMPDLVSSIEEDVIQDVLADQEQERREEQAEAAHSEPEPIQEILEDVRETESVTVQNNREERKKYFDILERAKELDDDSRQEIRIVYTVPKKVYPNAGMQERSSYADESKRVISIPVRADNEYEDASITIEDVDNSDPSAPETISADSPEVREEVAAVLEKAVEEIQAEPAFDLVEEPAPAAENIHIEEISVVSEPVGADVSASLDASASAEVSDNPGRAFSFEKVLFPDQYFYLRDGSRLRSVRDLRAMLESMNDDVYAHHAVERGTNDFATWIAGVYDHQECADRLRAARTKDEHVGILDAYL